MEPKKTDDIDKMIDNINLQIDDNYTNNKQFTWNFFEESYKKLKLISHKGAKDTKIKLLIGILGLGTYKTPFEELSKIMIDYGTSILQELNDYQINNTIDDVLKLTEKIEKLKQIDNEFVVLMNEHEVLFSKNKAAFGKLFTELLTLQLRILLNDCPELDKGLGSFLNKFIDTLTNKIKTVNETHEQLFNIHASGQENLIIKGGHKHGEEQYKSKYIKYKTKYMNEKYK